MAKGFLSRYAEVVTVDLGDGYWVKVRRYLQRSDFKVAQSILVSPTFRATGDESETSGPIDSAGYQDELVYRAVETWNLTDEDGVDLPLAPEAAKRHSIGKLPQDVFEAIAAKIEGATAVAKGSEDEPTATFPQAGPVGALGTPEGLTGASLGAEPVPDRDDILEGVGTNL